MKWVNAINEQSQIQAGSAGRASTLPALTIDPQSTGTQSVGFKKKFFTLSRKK